MSHTIIFPKDAGESRILELKGKKIVFRAFENLVYVEKPIVPEYQKLNLYVPEAYYRGGTINGFTAETAPIFIPNTAGAYAPGRADVPGLNFRTYSRNELNAAFLALEHGLVVAAPAVRGRGLTGSDGSFLGGAPACIVDLKAAVRYLRHNAGTFPGNVERMISDGTSAGGAISALLGTTGNCSDYEPYLKELGAANERDDIFAAVCFCPIMNLEHADMAYEWLLRGEDYFHSVRFIPKNGRIEMEPYDGVLDEEQKLASEELRKLFISYVDGLELEDRDGKRLTLDSDGLGGLRETVKNQLLISAKEAVRQGNDVSESAGVVLKNGVITDFDLDRHVKSLGRMKPVPAFDDWNGTSPENELFARGNVPAYHFTEFGAAHDKAGGTMADKKLVKMMNPMEYVDGTKSTVAGYWWIRHGVEDCHTSWAIPLLFAESLERQGKEVNFKYEWGKGHCGDYDMERMFAWVKEICK